MKQQNKDPNKAGNESRPPRPEDIDKQAQQEKAEVKEVAGRHKNDGQLGHKGRQ